MKQKQNPTKKMKYVVAKEADSLQLATKPVKVVT